MNQILRSLFWGYDAIFDSLYPKEEIISDEIYWINLLQKLSALSLFILGITFGVIIICAFIDTLYKNIKEIIIESNNLRNVNVTVNLTHENQYTTPENHPLKDLIKKMTEEEIIRQKQKEKEENERKEKEKREKEEREKKLEEEEKKKIPEELRCKICIDDKINAKLDGCYHTLCTKCALNILQNKGQCPFCRKEFRSFTEFII